MLRPIARLACLLYFRKIFLRDSDRVPRKGPLLIVCNHPSAFFEPCVLAVTLPRPLHFLTRGDFFKGGILSWFLRQTHQVPIFRAQDGFGSLRSNQSTFAVCYQTLSEGKAIIIFPESQTTLEKRLRPVQKGAARLALGALQHVDTLDIQPIGVTFSDPTKFGGLVSVRCGEIMRVQRPSDTDDEREVVARLTAQIEHALRGVVIHIERPEREPIFDGLQMLAFRRAQMSMFPVMTADAGFPEEEMRLAALVNGMSDTEAQEMRMRFHEYTSALAKHGITDRYLMQRGLWKFPWKWFLLPALPLFVIGKMVIAPPSAVLHSFLDAKVSRPPFYGALKWVLGFAVYALWFTAVVLAGCILFGVAGLIGALTIVMTGHLVMQYAHDLEVRGFLAPLMMPASQHEALIAQRSRADFATSA